MRKTFRTCNNKGFHITFPNGVTLSTQFGWGNYCENYDSKMPDYTKPIPDTLSDDCEIMIWYGDSDNTITSEWSKNDDTVQGRLSIDQWLSAFDFARNWTPSPEQ